jgi:hypothetical protein
MAEAPSDHRSVIFTPLGTGARTRAEGIPRAPRLEAWIPRPYVRGC